ncbi:MAG: HAD family hydrolase [Candidatus Rokubacteria bacterium]|nr:HAD family hydrolase [Candidatus Rokubacteria bacterium]
MIRAVTVDFWGTLVRDGPAADDRYRGRRLADFEMILAAAGLPVAARNLARGYRFSARELAWVWSRNEDVSPERHVAAILEGTEAGLSARVSEETVARLVDAYARPALASPPEADRGAAEGLRQLAARGLRLAVVSNTMRTPGRTLRKVLEGHGLLTFFDYLTFSDEVGVRKPAAEIFRLTLDRLEVDPGEAIHVGDDPVLDVEGARNASMRTIQVSAEDAPFARARADAAIRDLGELPDAVARLAAASR